MWGEGVGGRLSGRVGGDGGVVRFYGGAARDARFKCG